MSWFIALLYSIELLSQIFLPWYYSIILLLIEVLSSLYIYCFFIQIYQYMKGNNILLLSLISYSHGAMQGHCNESQQLIPQIMLCHFWIMQRIHVPHTELLIIVLYHFLCLHQPLLYHIYSDCHDSEAMGCTNRVGNRRRWRTKGLVRLTSCKLNYKVCVTVF